MLCPHSGHASDLISKPGLPGVMRASVILAKHLGQRALSFAANGTFEGFLG
jgi:hypothetical protein